MPRAVVILNPISGARGGGRRIETFRRALESAGWRAEILPTLRAGHAPELARAAVADGADVLVAAGGDGTLHEVVAGLGPGTESAPPVAILPLGTSNLVARELAIPTDPREAASVVVGRNEARIDVVDVTSAGRRRTMVACAGVGWDAAVVRGLASRRSGHITFSTWIGPILSALREYGFPPFRVTDADGRAEEAVLALFLNVRPYAAFFRPVPAARPDDGLLDVLLVRREAVRSLPGIAWRAFRGRDPVRPGVEVLRSPAFRVESVGPVPWQVDGDVGGDTPLAMLVRPRALRVLRPVGADR